MKKNLILCIAAVLSALSFLNGQEKAQFDKNFREAKVGKLEVHYYNALNKPFELNGFPWRRADGELNRLPETANNKNINGYARYAAPHTSGGTVRFRTDSPYMTIRASYRAFCDMNHMPRSGSGGFDLYMVGDDGKEVYLSSVRPGPGGKDLELRFNNVAGGKVRDYTVYMPLYSGVTAMEIGLKPGSKLLEPRPQKITKPIVFYGSSITHGGCASRPANSYTTMLCRAVDAPQINLGFSGGAKGETVMAEAIAKLDMAVFVYDYDYNAPNAAHLLKTHEPFFQIIRKAQPDLPVIILSRCSQMTDERRNAVKRTYDNAVKAGDKKVWFIDGSELFGDAGQNLCTVDGCHPNDLGFYMMYQRVLPVLKEALENSPEQKRGFWSWLWCW